MEQFMSLLVVEGQAFHHLSHSKQNGVFTEIMIMDLSSLLHLTIQTFCLSTRRVVMEGFMTHSDYQGIIGTF